LYYNTLIMKKMSAVLAVAFGFAAFIACGKSAPGRSGAGSSLADPQKKALVVLTVDTVSYTNEDFNAYVRTTVGEGADALTVPALSRLFDDFVDEKILLKQAQSKSVTLTDEERRQYVEKRRGATPGDSSPSTPAGDALLVERFVVEKYLAQLVMDLKIEDREVAAYYAEHKSEYLQPEKLQVSQILFSSEGAANEVRSRLNNASEEDFRMIARTRSVGPEGARGGVMGIFSAGQLPSELEKFIFPMKEGEISRVVESPYGYHIFRLDKWFEARLMSLEDAGPSIRAKLADRKSKEAVATHLETLKAGLDWKARTENLPFAYQRNKT
jgi:parvulin-like peptidyl-prolyl isomerase